MELSTISMLDPNRWFALISFSIFSFSNAAEWVTFSSIELSTREYFSLTTMQLNLLSMIFMIVFIFFFFLSCSVFEKWGIKKAVLVGNGLNALGSILKFALGLTFPSFTTLMIPQTILAIAQLFVSSTPPILATQYFPKERRVFVTAVSFSANLLGSAVGLLVPALIVDQASKWQFQILFGIQLALSCGVFVACAFFLKNPVSKNKDNHAPLSDSSSPDSTKWTASTRTLYDALKQLFVSKNFLFLLGAFSITTGSVWSVASILPQIYYPLGLSQLDAGIASAGNVVGGSIVAYLLGLWLGRSRNFRIPIIFCLFCSFLVMLGFLITCVAAPVDTFPIKFLCIFLVILAGFFQITLVPFFFEFGMDITYPVAESLPGAVLMAFSYLISLIIILAASFIMGNGLPTRDSAIYSVILIVGISALGIISFCFTRKPDPSKSNVNKNNESAPEFFFEEVKA